MDLLLVIDMQNVYLPGSPWACEGIVEASQYIEKIIPSFNHVVFTLFRPPESPKGQWCEYNRINQKIDEDEWMNEPLSIFKPYMNQRNTYFKSTYAFHHPILEDYDTIYITGVVAECCVLSTIFSLIDEGKKVIILEPGIAGETRHKTQEIKDLLQGLSPLHVEFKSSH